MPRGMPDYKKSFSQYGQEITDHAELAARLGSIDVIERRGSVYFMDDFSSLLSNWQIYEDDGGIVTTRLGYGYYNGVCCKIIPGVNFTPYSGIIKRIPLLTVSRVGIECLFSVIGDASYPPSEFQLGLHYHSAGVLTSFMLRLNVFENSLSYLAKYGVYNTYTAIKTDYPNMYWDEEIKYFNYMKLVIDLNDLSYGRYVLNNWGGMMNHPGASKTPGDTVDNLCIELRVHGNGSNNPTYIDNVILTLDEP